MSKQYTKAQAFVVFSLNKLQESLDLLNGESRKYAHGIVVKAEEEIHKIATSYESFVVYKMNLDELMSDSPFNEDPLEQGPLSFDFAFFSQKNFLDILEDEDFTEKAAIIICNAAVQVGLISFVESMSEMEHGGTVGVVVHSALVNNNAEKGKDNMLISASKIVVNGLDKNVEDALRASHLDYLSRPDLNESVVN